jgi:signal transduction histidine kinase
MPEELTSTLQKIYRLSDSLKHQIDDILNLAKMRRGGFEPCASHINLGDLLKKCEHLSEGLCINQPNAEFKARLLIDQGLSSEFICDGRIIETILRNLIGNAIKFSDPDRSNMVDIILHRSLGKLTIVVSDKGIGIADEHKEKIFEEFYQVASEARRRYEGSGLGLAMVSRYVENLGGHITMESELGAGTKISVELPEIQTEPLEPPSIEAISLPLVSSDTTAHKNLYKAMHSVIM